MYFGTTTFKCSECDHFFTAPAIEWMATAYLVPQPCPKCKSIRTYPFAQIMLRPMYTAIWKTMEKDKGENK